MADLRTRFIEDYAGGLLNVSRQELSTTGEVLSQDGFTSEGTTFVEDGSGVKSGLKLGVSLAEVVDPTTESGIVNVRFADRTYAKVRDLRIFTTAVASTQAALSEAVSTSISNIETTLQLLEDDVTTLDQNIQASIDTERKQLQELSLAQKTLSEEVAVQKVSVQQLDSRVSSLENPEVTAVPIGNVSVPANQAYYAGTIQIASGVVTGTGTLFSADFVPGDTFLATTSAGKVVEFTVASIDNATNPNTVMRVTPSDVNISAGGLYRKNSILDLQNKINEIIAGLKTLDLFV
jgi:hypothetical protein